MESRCSGSRRRRLLIALPLVLACRDGAVVATADGRTPPPSSVEDRVLPEVTSGTVVSGGGLHLAEYENGNPSGPALVFIHGFTGSYLSWERQLSDARLTDFHLVAYDLRGHGASDKPLDPAQYTDGTLWADDLDALIRARHLDHPVLVGWSYGGFVISDYLRRYGDGAIGGVVFVGAVTNFGTPEAAGYLSDDVLAIFPDVLSSDLGRSVDGTRALTRMFANPLRGSEWERSYGTAMIVPPVVRAAMFNRALDNDDVLARLEVPTLVVQGTTDRIVRMSAAAHIAATVPGARLLAYEGVGHAVQLEAPQRFDRDLADFVRGTRRRQP